MPDGYTYSGAPDECSIHYPTKLICGRCPICQAFSPEEQKAMKWGLELYSPTMHEINIGIKWANCSCGWMAKADENDRHVELAQVHAEHKTPATIKDNRNG